MALSCLRSSPPKSKCLVVRNVGPGALDIVVEDNCWDLLEVYFETNSLPALKDGTLGGSSDFLFFESDQTERKYRIFHGILTSHAEIWHYDFIMFMDDDVLPIGCKISDIFREFESTGLRIGQPALTRDSYFSHKITLAEEGLRYRVTSFCEVMTPIFRIDALDDYQELFCLTKSGWGLDVVWSYFETLAGKGVAILDSVPVKHTRPVGKGGGQRGQTLEEDQSLLLGVTGATSLTQSCLEAATSEGEVVRLVDLELQGDKKAIEADWLVQDAAPDWLKSLAVVTSAAFLKKKNHLTSSQMLLSVELYRIDSQLRKSELELSELRSDILVRVVMKLRKTWKTLLGRG